MPVPKPMERKQAAYSNLDERYAIQGEKYQGQQYSHIYFTRLHHMRNLLHALVPSWKPQLPVTTVLGLEEGKDCIIVGTLYKHMKLKPSILDEYAKEVKCSEVSFMFLQLWGLSLITNEVSASTFPPFLPEVCNSSCQTA